MIVSLGNQEKTFYKEKLRERKVVQHFLDKGIENIDSDFTLELPQTVYEDDSWDGYLHPSYLDWSKSAEKQLVKLENKGKYNAHATANRMYYLGNLLHAAVQHLVSPAFTLAYPEIGLRIEKYAFKGTSDFIGYHPTLGWVLFEFKSYGELQRDATLGKTLNAKLDGILSGLRTEHNQSTKPLHSSEYASSQANISYAHMAHIRTRLMNCERDMSKAQEDHVCQAFTYTWLLQMRGFGVQRRKKQDGTEVLAKRDIPRIDRVCVCYIGKSKFETVEFWYSVKKHQHLIEKAKDNYISVFKEASRRGFIS